jgi:hypothetical protein
MGVCLLSGLYAPAYLAVVTDIERQALLILSNRRYLGYARHYKPCSNANPVFLAGYPVVPLDLAVWGMYAVRQAGQ